MLLMNIKFLIGVLIDLIILIILKKCNDKQKNLKKNMLKYFTCVAPAKVTANPANMLTKLIGLHLFACTS